MRYALAAVMMTCLELSADDSLTLSAQRVATLQSIARTASVMVDGDVCDRILTPRALRFIINNPSKDQWAAADNYDVDDQAFTLTKKTLMRLALLADFPVDVNLWMPLNREGTVIHIVIRNRFEMSQFWPWGALSQPAPMPMRQVLADGQTRTVREKPGFVSVLAPVKNSLDDIVGLVEVVTRPTPDARENVK